MTKIFSIKEEYTKKIYSKEKLLELRRQNVNVEINEICLIYTTHPVKKITGYFIVKNKIRLPLKELWKKTKRDSGVSEKVFFEYFNGCEFGTAIFFKKVMEWEFGVGLEEIKKYKKDFTPPQSYFKIDIEIIRMIKFKKLPIPLTKEL
jgi:predicted transcriptional regulator